MSVMNEPIQKNGVRNETETGAGQGRFVLHKYRMKGSPINKLCQGKKRLPPLL
jgi:hypothetical protein